MRQPFLFLTTVWASTTLSVMLALPVRAQLRQITTVEFIPIENELILDLEAGQVAQARILQASFGNTVILDILGTQLVGGVELRQAVPINGIELITVEPLDVNSVRISIVGTIGVPTVAVNQNDTGLTVNVTPARQLQVSCRRCSLPDYPESALRAGIEGEVFIRVTFDAEGRVTEAYIEQSSGHVALDQAALEAVSNFEFEVWSSDGRGGSLSFGIPFVIEDELPSQDAPPIQE